MVSCALVFLGACVGDELGPSAACRECPPVVEPGGTLDFELAWHEEPCEDDSRALGPLLRFCTEVDFDGVLECSGPCEVDDEWDVTPTAPADPFTITARLTRRDTGEVHEETFAFRVTSPDRLELRCADDCRYRERSGGGGYYALELLAFAGDDPIALDRSALSSELELGGWNDEGDGVYASYVDARRFPQTVVVTHAGGLSAAVEVPAYP